MHITGTIAHNHQSRLDANAALGANLNLGREGHDASPPEARRSAEVACYSRPLPTALPHSPLFAEYGFRANINFDFFSGPLFQTGYVVFTHRGEVSRGPSASRRCQGEGDSQGYCSPRSLYDTWLFSSLYPEVCITHVCPQT